MSAQAAFVDLYSAAIPSLPDLYSAFDMSCAVAPALKARPIAIAIALILSLVTVAPCLLNQRAPRWRYRPLIGGCSRSLLLGGRSAARRGAAAIRRRSAVRSYCRSRGMRSR